MLGREMAAGPSPVRMLWITAAWSGCFIGTRWALADAPVHWLATSRALLAGVALLGLGIAQHRPLPRGHVTWGLVAALGVLDVTVGLGAMLVGVARGATGVAAVLSSAQPLLILVPAWVLFGERLDARMAWALVGGFVGLVLVAVPGGGGEGALVSLLSAAAVTGGTLLSRALGSADAIMVSAWHFLIGGGVLGIVALVAEGTPSITWTPGFVAVLGFLGLVSSAAAFVGWFHETQRSSLASLTAWTFLVPVFGVVIGVAALGERPGPWTAAGLALVLAAFSRVLRPRAQSQLAASRAGLTPRSATGTL